jgi:hypothetical protein
MLPLSATRQQGLRCFIPMGRGVKLHLHKSSLHNSSLRKARVTGVACLVK